MDDRRLVENLAKNMIGLRRVKSMTQVALAAAAGIPRTTITNMESGGGNPTLTAVGKVAAAMQVSLEELLATPRGEHKLILSSDVPVVEKSGGRARQYKLLPDPIRGMEIDRMELAANTRLKGVPHVARTKEYLTCLQGEVEVNTAGEKFHLKKGDVLAFPGDEPHSYYNRGSKTCICVSVVALAY